MKIYLKKIILAAATGLMLSCVPIKKYQKLEKSVSYKEKDLERLKKEYDKCCIKYNVLKDSLDRLTNLN
jgi:hypothetical protein